MKKLVFSAALMAAACGANAQKGSWYAGGTLGFSSTDNKTENNGTTANGTKLTSWTFSPEVGTFLTDHVQLGVGLSFTGSKNDARAAVTNYTKTTYTGGTIYSRYFFGGEKFRPFVGVNVSVLPGISQAVVGNTTTKYKIMTIGANLNAGFAYGLSERFTVVGSLGTLGFEHKTVKADGSDSRTKSSSFGLDANTLGNRFTVGVYYTL